MQIRWLNMKKKRLNIKVRLNINKIRLNANKIRLNIYINQEWILHHFSNHTMVAQIKRTVDNSLQEQKYQLSHPSSLLYIKDCNNLSEELLKIESTVQFKTKILSFIRPKENWIFKIHDINGLKLLSRIRLHF